MCDRQCFVVVAYVTTENQTPAQLTSEAFVLPPPIMSAPNEIADSQPSTSETKWAPEKITRVARDIKDSPKISLLSLLTALLARLLLDASNDDAKTYEASFPEKVRQSKDIVELMRQDATTFCDNESNMRASETKKHLCD